MNYDNLHTAAEILEAFQGCRDAGEQIDYFDALSTSCLRLLLGEISR
jgi:hypothetical protein